MGIFWQTVTTSIKIDAPPAFVRKTLLDFPTYHQWANRHFKSISAAPTAELLSDGSPAVGSALNVELTGMKFAPTVVTNTDNEFAWLGRLLVPKVLFDGRHSFLFNTGDASGQTTDFVHSEEFVGLLVPLVVGGGLEDNFKAFNEELKMRVEETYKP